MNYSEKWKAERERKAYLALADGTVFHGVAFGAKKDALGEVVFNTGMCGYQEILTDPSYAGQFVTLTPAEVGNYGINSEDIESRKLFLSGLVIGDLTAPSNWRSEKSLDDYLKENGVPGIYGVDTRALTLHLREHGNQKAFLYVGERGTGNVSPERSERRRRLNAGWEWGMGNGEEGMGNGEEGRGKREEGIGKREEGIGECEAIAKAREWEGLDGQDYAAKVTCEKEYEMPVPHSPLPVPHVVCYDFGVKTNILRSLASWAKVTVVPAKTPAEEVLAMNPDGVFLSNGPADPAAVTYAIENIQKLLGIRPLDKSTFDSRQPTAVTTKRQTTDGSNFQLSTSNFQLPLMGICLGHQLLSLACGAKTGRLKFGHHGCNHPVKNLATGHVEITSQNHNFAVLPETVPDCLEVTHINLNDNSIEGVRHKTLPAFSVQYHPESCPGPHDSKYLFDEFKKMIMNHETH